MPDLEDRVAALEAAMPRGLRPFDLAPLTAEQEAQIRRDFDETMRGPFTHRVLQQPPPLTPEQVRYLLRECVTVVKPGETLVIRGRDWTPNQVQEIQRIVDAMHEDGTIGFKVLIIFGDELGVVQPEAAPGAA